MVVKTVRPEGKGKIPERKPKKTPKPPSARDILKAEIADQLGLGDKLRALGWGGLSARESGRIGGMISRLQREKGT